MTSREAASRATGSITAAASLTGSTRIRDATPADARAIASVQIDVWRTTYRGHFPDAALDGLDLDRGAQRREQRLRDLPAKEFCLVAERGGAVVGFVMGGPREFDPTSDEGEVYAIYVRDEHQRGGVGRALLAEAARRLHEHGLRALLIWVLRENAKGRSFYERMGGRAERERPFEIAGAQIIETGYVWADTAPLRDATAADQRVDRPSP
jgi:ribosomal protein S18 acetylase RimI-like enzyme